MASDWKHFFTSSLKRSNPINAENLYVNTRKKKQKGGLMDPPIKLVTPTMQVTEQAKDSLSNPSNFSQLSKQKRSYKKRKTKVKRAGKRKPKKTTKRKSKKTTKRKLKKKTTKRKTKNTL
jgi:hypothetical protein